jgi:hypothetical protein
VENAMLLVAYATTQVKPAAAFLRIFAVPPRGLHLQAGSDASEVSVIGHSGFNHTLDFGQSGSCD